MVESLAQASSLDLKNLPDYIEQFSGELEPYSLEGKPSHLINQCFSASTVADIVLRLKRLSEGKEAELSPAAIDWATKTLKTLETMSPTALVATLALLHRGKGATLKECLSMEFNLAKNFLEKVPDLREGFPSKE